MHSNPARTMTTALFIPYHVQLVELSSCIERETDWDFSSTFFSANKCSKYSFYWYVMKMTENIYDNKWEADTPYVRKFKEIIDEEIIDE